MRRILLFLLISTCNAGGYYKIRRNNQVPLSMAGKVMINEQNGDIMINVNKKTPEVTLCLYIDSYDADTRINSLYIDVILLEYGSVPTLFFLIGTDLLFALDQNSVGNWVESKPLAFESTFKLMNYTFDVVGSDKSLLYYKNMRNINDFFTKITNASAAENPVTLTINETQRQANADFGVQIVLRLGDEQKNSSRLFYIAEQLSPPYNINFSTKRGSEGIGEICVLVVTFLAFGFIILSGTATCLGFHYRT